MGRYAAVDVYYPAAGGATGALLVASDPAFADVVGEHVVHYDPSGADVAAYRAGAFYERELPPIRAVVAGHALDLLVVDGYVTLDAAGRPGLGAHVHDDIQVPVIGVAKTGFRGATHAVAVYRGGSARPLFVTAAGLAPADAADLVRAMSGPYRLPDALKRVDTLSRSRSAE